MIMPILIMSFEELSAHRHSPEIANDGNELRNVLGTAGLGVIPSEALKELPVSPKDKGRHSREADRASGEDWDATMTEKRPLTACLKGNWGLWAKERPWHRDKARWRSRNEMGRSCSGASTRCRVGRLVRRWVGSALDGLAIRSSLRRVSLRCACTTSKVQGGWQSAASAVLRLTATTRDSRGLEALVRLRAHSTVREIASKHAITLCVSVADKGLLRGSIRSLSCVSLRFLDHVKRSLLTIVLSLVVASSHRAGGSSIHA